MRANKMYLLDTNIYINFYDRCYRFKYFPQFWENFAPIMKNKVILPKVVYDEITRNQEFKDWLSNHSLSGYYYNHKDCYREWGEVIHHLATSGYYNEKALTDKKSWTHEKIADGWLIAIAKKEGYTIVSDEVPNYNLNKNNPSKSAKIPDVARELGVRCITMNNFFDEIQFSV